MPTYAPSWEQTSPSPPFVHGGGGTLTHRENVGAGAHVLPAESGQQLTPGLENINVGSRLCWGSRDKHDLWSYTAVCSSSYSIYEYTSIKHPL